MRQEEASQRAVVQSRTTVAMQLKIATMAKVPNLQSSK